MRRLCMVASAIGFVVAAAMAAPAGAPAGAAATATAAGDLMPLAALPYKPGVPVKSEGNADIAALVPRAVGVEALVRRMTGPGKADRLRFEAVGVLARPARYADPKTRPSEDEDRAKIAGILNAVGGMQGLDYWSASRNTWRTLYERSYRVASPESAERLPDLPEPAAGAVPSAWSYFAFQKDLTFGENVYRYELTSDPDGFTTTSSNETPMKVLFVTAVAPGDMKATLAILPARDGILVYAITTMKAMEALKRKAFDSVGNRAYALFWWFATRAQAAGIAVAPAVRPIAAE